MAGKYYKSFEHLLKPDPIFNDLDVAKFISCIMHDGKRSTAEKIFYGALGIVRERIKEREPIEVFKQAIDNVRPMVEVRSKRVGGANYQVPVEVNAKRQRTLAFRWLLEGKKTKDEILAQFLNNFDGARGNNDGVVTWEEFYDYYSDLSMSTPSDEFFVRMMESTW